MTWAIGDIQGCFDAFMELLKKIEFDPSRDRLWLVGDLVNRGDGSLETLEFIYKHQEVIEVVLGNHDIALIAAYYGLKKSNKTLDPILDSPNAERLVNWLRCQKILHVDTDYVMAHAGIPPNFDINDAIFYANKLRNYLSGDNTKEWLASMMKTSNKIGFGATPLEHDTFALSGFLRMRYCFEDGSLELDHKGNPNDTQELTPWYLHPDRKQIGQKIIFGHWSTLGFYSDNNVVALDTGCVWGGTLSAFCLEDMRVCSISCKR